MKNIIFKNLAATICCIFSSFIAISQSNFIPITPIASGDTLVMAAGIALDKNDNVWMGASLDDGIQHNILLFEFDGNSWQRYKIPNVIYPPVIAFNDQMAIDTNNVIWFCFETTLRAFDIATQVDSAYYFNNTYVDQVIVDKVTNTKWMVTNSQEAVASWDGATFTEYDTLNQLGAIISDITVDSFGNLYVLFSGSPPYLLKFDGSQWIEGSTFGYPSVNDHYKAICDNNNNLWVCISDSIGSALLKYDGTNFTTYRPPVNIDLGIPSDLKCDQKGNIWIVSGVEIIKYDGSMFTSYPINFSFFESNMGIDKLNNIWIGHHLQLPGCYLFNEKGFKNISGNVYNDINQNGTRDAGENGLANEIINTSDNTFALTDSLGNYTVPYIDSTQLCTVNHSLRQYRVQTSIPASYNLNPSIDPVTGIDFGIGLIPGINDFSISAFLFPVRNGFNAYGSIVCHNDGTSSVSDTVTLVLDSQLSFVSSTSTPLSVSGNTIKWLTPILNPDDSYNINFTALVSASAPLNDTLLSVVTIATSVQDETPANNTFNISSIVTGSFDPNEKEVHPIAHVNDDDPLYYTIHFQNTGTDTAFNIIIRDSLESDLDPSTFRLVSSSHTVIPELNNTGNLKFSFYNILLPDSNINEPLSHGYVTYSVQPKNNSQPGTLINNTAYIYFDYNQPIVTNTTTTIIETVIGIDQTTTVGNYIIYPNPASDKITVSTKQKIDYYTLSTAGGSIVYAQQNNAQNNFQINLAKLKSGIYFLKLYSSEGVLIGKVLKY